MYVETGIDYLTEAFAKEKGSYEQMDHLTFCEVKTQQQITAAAALAKEIWTQHYLPIIGREQVDYMLEKYQSAAAIRRQIDAEDYHYFLLLANDAPIGYIGIVLEKRSLFLSKLYIKKEFRGKGYAVAAIAFCSEICQENGLEKIWLTVNKHNTGSIAAYRQMGFVTVREQAADIGSGFVMDDYIMERNVL